MHGRHGGRTLDSGLGLVETIHTLAMTKNTAMPRKVETKFEVPATSRSGRFSATLPAMTSR